MPLPLPDPAAFLAKTPLVDFGDPPVWAKARALLGASPEETARSCFDWVRDHITHSVDAGRAEVPFTASEVLVLGTGLCYAKSHLLVALWRAHGLPAGFCYQRLTFSEGRPPYCIHGFTAVLLPSSGWYRCDARGNTRAGVYGAFTPPVEHLAYLPEHPGEHTFPGVWAEPWPALVAAHRGLTDLYQYCRLPFDLVPPVGAQWCET